MGAMPCMDNVNKLIYHFAIPFVLIAYCLFVIYDYNFYDGNGRVASIEKHTSNIKNTNIDALILGGSNSYLSLSAETLSLKSDHSWYNLSLFSEGYTDENYMHFLKEEFGGAKSKDIRIIIYSTIYPNREERFILERQTGKMNIAGRRKSIKPNYSFISHIRNSIDKGMLYPLPNKYGDFDFNNFDCILKGKSDFRPVHVDISSVWLQKNLISIQSIFPDAHIIVVSPSEFFDNPDNLIDTTLHAERLFNSLTALNKKNNVNINFSMIGEASYNKKNLLCDDYHHANSKGRNYRTQNLYTQIIAANQESIRYE